MVDNDSGVVVRAERLGRRFGTEWAIRDIDIAVAPGEIFGLVGPDGAGKTTLLQLLASILDPGEGRCAVLGANGAIYAWRRASECKHGRADEKGKADAA